MSKVIAWAVMPCLALAALWAWIKYRNDPAPVTCEDYEDWARE